MNAKTNRPDLARRCLVATVLLLGALVVPVGCFTATGHRPTYAPTELIALADQACQRGDRSAARMLLERLVDDHADAPEADRAQVLLAQPSPCPVAAPSSVSTRPLLPE